MAVDSEIKKKAELAKHKKAAYGQDIDLDKFGIGRKDIGETKDLRELKEEDQKTLLNVGVVPSDEGRSGSFVLMDNSVVHEKQLGTGVEVMSLQKALKVHDWLQEYNWKAVKADADKYTARTFIEEADGYFIHALPGQKVKLPVQTCLMLKSQDVAQTVHNIIIIEEGAELEVITGCSTSKHVDEALHLGISEFYLKKNAKLTFTMIHNWAENIGVRPRTVVEMDEGAVYINNYIALKPVKTIQAYPTANMNGPNGVCVFNTVAIAHPGSEMDLGSKVMMNAPGCKAEIVSRTITTGGKMIARGLMVGAAKDVKGHLECKGLILSNKGIQIAIPELDARVPEVEMTHEAAVGKIAQDQIEYLMSRGLTEEEAVGIIVKGFLDVGIRGLPPALKEEIDATLEKVDLARM
ncbi:MAG: SufD family Fe-S cluster assembly protein [Euryarchaeota archaeon]|nr:SufD family Fe-S cluster assembly protein [Euryarchaeota archaeon]